MVRCSSSGGKRDEQVEEVSFLQAVSADRGGTGRFAQRLDSEDRRGTVRCHEFRDGDGTVDLKLRELVRDDDVRKFIGNDGERLLPSKKPIVNQHARFKCIALGFHVRRVPFLSDKQSFSVPADPREAHDVVRRRFDPSRLVMTDH
ncbi:hypothetical protein [Curtobacterium luteum]|uniref:hypothetical protein n=1 Tax=Curtobacterium luteum TaxID=33881 RepID=UPI0037FAA9D2